MNTYYAAHSARTFLDVTPDHHLDPFEAACTREEEDEQLANTFEHDLQIETISRIFELCSTSDKKPPEERLISIFRRFVGLCHIVRPDILEGCSQIELARMLNCTSAAISKIENRLADQIGFRGAGQKSDVARSNMAEGQLHRKSSNRATADPDHITNIAAQRHAIDVRDTLERAREKFWKPRKTRDTDGTVRDRFAVFGTVERRILRETGMIDDNEKFTQAGANFFCENHDMPESHEDGSGSTDDPFADHDADDAGGSGHDDDRHEE